MGEPRVRQAKRAGGYVNTARGWELASKVDAGPAAPAEPAPAVEPDQTDPLPRLDHVNVEVPREMVGPDPERQECPDCGKPVPVNKNGSLRKHTCVIEAPEPQVTFDGEDGV